MVFAGLTVLIALSALSVVGIPFLTTMGIAAAATVFIAVLVALTLLPAVLGLMKSKAFAGRVRRAHPKRDADGKLLNNGVRWARFVGRKPAAVVILVVVALGALAIPLKDLHLAFPTDSTASTQTTQRKASDLIADSFGPGRDAPLLRRRRRPRDRLTPTTARRRTARSPAGPPTRRAWPTPRSSCRTRPAPAPRSWSRRSTAPTTPAPRTC